MAELGTAGPVVSHLDFLAPPTFDDGPPHAALAELRSQSPVVWVDDGDAGYWVVLGHPELIEVSSNPRLFSSWEMSCFPKDPRPNDLIEVRQMLLNMDPPQHTAFRRIVNRVFTPRMVREMADSMERHAREVVAGIPRGETFDFVGTVSVEMSLRVLADVMGIPRADASLLYDWTERLVGDGDTELGGDPKAFLSAILEMFEYADEQTVAKRAHPGEDVWSLVANAEVDGERLTKEELNRFFQLLATAGNETTRTLISAGQVLLHEHPDQARAVRLDLGQRVNAAVEEMLRHHSPIMQFRRTAMAAVEVAGVEIQAGDKVLISYVAANRDPRVFAAPDTVDLARDPNPHVAFGIGPHFCLGANLARAQARALFGELLAQDFTVEVVDEPVRVGSTLVDGYRSIPARAA